LVFGGQFKLADGGQFGVDFPSYPELFATPDIDKNLFYASYFKT
jgi:hypothetical protein